MAAEVEAPLVAVDLDGPGTPALEGRIARGRV